jgi:hypothetical protein
MNKKTIADIILVCSVVLIAVVMLIVTTVNKKNGDKFEISVGGRVYGTYSLSEDRTVDVDGLCVVRVKDGAVYMESSTCKGGDCVKHKPISKSGESIICLPNSVVIRVLGETEADAVI